MKRYLLLLVTLLFNTFSDAASTTPTIEITNASLIPLYVNQNFIYSGPVSDPPADEGSDGETIQRRDILLSDE
jgi:hypothetical protein